MNVFSITTSSLYPVTPSKQLDPVAHGKPSDHNHSVPEAKPAAASDIGGTPGHLDIKV